MIKVDSDAFNRAIKELEGIFENSIPAINVITSKTINNASKRAKKETVQQLLDDYYIDKKPLDQSISITKSTPNSLEAKVFNNRRQHKDRFTLSRFKVEESSSGPLKVAQSRSGGLIELKRAFLASPKNQPGNIQVFRREEGKRAKGVRGDSHLIQVQRSYSVGGMIGASSLERYVNETIQEYVDELFPKEIDNYFNKVSKQ